MISTLLASRQPPSSCINSPTASHPLPTAQEMREHILHRLYYRARGRLVESIREVQTRSKESQFTAENRSSPLSGRNDTQITALSVELWRANTRRTPSEGVISNDGASFVDIVIHWQPSSPIQEKQSILYATEKIVNRSHVIEAVLDSFQLIRPHSDTCQALFYPIVTNNPKLMFQLLHPSNCPSELYNRIILIPCIVYALLSSLMIALELPQMVEFLQICREKLVTSQYSPPTGQKAPEIPGQDLKDSFNRNQSDEGDSIVRRKSETAERSNELLPIRSRIGSGSDLDVAQSTLETKFDEVYKLLLKIQEHRDALCLEPHIEKVFEELFGTVLNMRKTIQFIKHGKRSVSISMIKPILLNMRHSRLVGQQSQPGKSSPREPDDSDSLVYQFKEAILAQLNQFYPGEGPLEETLLLSSLLDPRFKSCLLALCPDTSRLLRLKLKQVFKKSHEDGALKSEEHSFLDEQITNELERYLCEASLPATEDSMEWWKEQATSNYPHLSQLAIPYLMIPLYCGRTEMDEVQIPSSGQNTPLSAVSGQSWSECDRQSQRSETTLSGSSGLLRRAVIAPDDVSYYSFLWHNWQFTSPR
ncbi:unnamed protein product [Echinostoma caproni]|uniref:HAT C-terminal dimerisation domain-containing protein n=1 Tax=Echinostoma caproni TaxID=27848 RepID=A0A3P8GY18_9TREM|nr:unnamed protein product [Echinostoma caproni]